MLDNLFNIVTSKASDHKIKTPRSSSKNFYTHPKLEFFWISFFFYLQDLHITRQISQDLHIHQLTIFLKPNVMTFGNWPVFTSSLTGLVKIFMTIIQDTVICNKLRESQQVQPEFHSNTFSDIFQVRGIIKKNVKIYKIKFKN